MEVILGVAASLLVQFFKNTLKLGEYATLAAVVAVSMILAAIYTVLVQAGLWQSVATILVVAGAFYTFIIERFQSKG